jgi:acetyl-CoA carboxylase biotin carboxylase subunit/3-methylcrotonyl-CoA carboxylase alpha subunit
MGIATVAVYSEADAGAPHVVQADESVCIGAPPVIESYLQIDRIVTAARERGVDAIHPGYGLLSENPAFARVVRDAGIAFVGPPPEVLEALGDKLRARAVARAAGVEPPPGSQDAIVTSDESAVQAAVADIGYPLLVKAAAGGGGIGMQVVHNDRQLARALKSCADRGRSAFGDERIYLERYVESPKHIEVQILGDAEHHVIAIGERECSMQRRHQKIIEEAPSAAPFLTDDKRRALHEAAVAVASRAGYVNAGTVEFVAAADGAFFFLEVNARLQVEHCVTEMCTGIDLVEQQLRVAAGQSIAKKAPSLEGHAIEARIYAEDPDKRFAPQPGRLDRLRWPNAKAWLRIETGVVEGMEVTPYYDPLIAKVVAHGETRAQAIERLDEALGESEIELTGPNGRANTNLSFCRRLITSERFRDGSYDTHYAEALAKAK